MTVLKSHHEAHPHFWRPQLSQAWHDRLSWVVAGAVVAALIGYHLYLMIGT